MQAAVEFDLAKLLGTIELEAFFRDSWEKQPLAVSRNDPTYYNGLFSRRDLDRVIAFTRPQFRDAEIVKPGVPRPNFVQGWLPDDEPFAGFYPDLPTAQRAFAQGKTILLNSMQQRWPALAAMSRHLETFFGCPVHTYLLLTPPGAQGLSPHYDAYEIFVLQIDGVKHWRFYGPARQLPLATDQASIPRDQLGPPTKEVFLQPGDLLYMPRGHVHEAFTSDQASLHLTVGVRVYRWLDLLQRALLELATSEPSFRQSLPPGFLGNGALTSSQKAAIRERLQLLAQNANLEEALEAMTAAFLGGLRPLPQGYFADDPPDHIDLDTMLERAPGMLCRVIRKKDGVTLHAPGTRIDGPGKVASALEFVAATRRFTPRALPDTLTESAKLVLVQRLIREKLLTVANPLITVDEI
jgi:ribosomal protein L16 Arg81 hydroxylase